MQMKSVFVSFLCLGLFLGIVFLAIQVKPKDEDNEVIELSSVEKRFPTAFSVRQEIERQTALRTGIAERTYSRDKEFEVLLKGPRNKETQKKFLELLERN